MTRRFSLGKLVDALPANSLLYRFCIRYVNHYNGENNDDMRSNGELRWLRKVLPQCSIVFDVGANIGEWTALALNINPHLQVHCFEPSATTFRRLQVRHQGQRGVTLNNFGLSAAPGEMTLWVFADCAGINSLYKRQGLEDGFALAEQQYGETVRLETLDAYCERLGVRQIDLLKVDVEGHELMVLKGAAQILAQGRLQRIQFEYGGTYIDARILLKDMFELLTSYGYRLHKIYPHALRPVDRYDQRLENFQYQNWVALR
jgi:FkbM family methyltransferase